MNQDEKIAKVMGLALAALTRNLCECDGYLPFGVVVAVVDYTIEGDERPAVRCHVNSPHGLTNMTDAQADAWVRKWVKKGLTR